MKRLLVILFIVLMFALAVRSTCLAQIMHCGEEHPGGPYTEFKNNALYLHTTDPGHKFIGGFQFIFSFLEANPQLSPELSVLHDMVYIKTPMPQTGYIQVSVFFWKPNGWSSGTRVLTFDSLCDDGACSGVVQGVVPWWVRTTAHPDVWYAGWRDHVGTGPTTPWPLSSVSLQAWGAVKELYK